LWFRGIEGWMGLGCAGDGYVNFKISFTFNFNFESFTTEGTGVTG